VRVKKGYHRVFYLILIEPLTGLFKLIYHFQQILEQSLFVKIIHFHDKGDEVKIENYGPIAKMCSTIEQLILNAIS
jgi:hypothetical protein